MAFSWHLGIEFFGHSKRLGLEEQTRENLGWVLEYFMGLQCCFIALVARFPQQVLLLRGSKGSVCGGP